MTDVFEQFVNQVEEKPYYPATYLMWEVDDFLDGPIHLPAERGMGVTVAACGTDRRLTASAGAGVSPTREARLCPQCKAVYDNG